MEIVVSCKSVINNILVSGIVSRRDKLNTKATQINIHLKNEHKRNICFIDNSNIDPRYNCSRGGKVEPISSLKICCLSRVNSATDIMHR